MVAVGDGDKKVQLEESSIVLRQFKQLVSGRKFGVVKGSKVTFFDQVLNLARFLDKYECELAIHHYVETLQRNIIERKWPDLLLFLSGVIFDRSELCTKAVDMPAYPWSHYDQAWHPKGVKEDDLYSLHPVGMPLHLRDMIPADYTLALALTGMLYRPQYGGNEGSSDLYGVDFSGILSDLEEQRKPAEGKPKRKKLKRTRMRFPVEDWNPCT